MILVAGLAVAGLVGIAAAFYFSIRSGNGGDRRVRSAGAGRAGTDRRPGSRSSGTARPDRTENARRAANGSRSANADRGANVSSHNYRAEGSTGPHPVLDFGDPVLVGGRRGGPGGPARPRTGGDSRTGGRRPEARPGQQVPTVPAPAFAAGSADDTPGDAWPGDSWPGDSQATDPRLGAAKPGESEMGSRASARPSRESHAGRGAAKPRRRVGFRKGADVDEEMWPAETFGDVTDEQFWDDLASDKPLTTTARTAQQDSGARNRPLDAPPPADTQAVQALGLGDNRVRGEGRRGAGSGAYPESRTGPNPAAERTAIQPAYTATRPVQSMAPQVPSATQPVQAAAAAGQPASAAGLAMSAAGQAIAATQPGGARGRRRARSSDDEDPLTSAAFSLRSSGPVDGRSSLAPRGSRDMTRERYDAAVAQETQTFSLADTEAASGGYPAGAPPFRQYESPAGSRASEPRTGEPRTGGTAPYPYSGTPYGDPSSVTQSVNTPPYGESYGYQDPAAQADDPRRQNGTRSHARHGGHGEGSRAPRQPYPQDGYQGTGGYPAGGYPAGGYPGSGYQGNGHRAPYDQREDYRRLTHQR